MSETASAAEAKQQENTIPLEHFGFTIQAFKAEAGTAVDLGIGGAEYVADYDEDEDEDEEYGQDGDDLDQDDEGDLDEDDLDEDEDEEDEDQDDDDRVI